jgi:hypothetical protein
MKRDDLRDTTEADLIEAVCRVWWSDWPDVPNPNGARVLARKAVEAVADEQERQLYRTGTCPACGERPRRGGMAIEPGDVKSFAEIMAESIGYEDHYILLIGFEQEPPGVYEEIERLGGDVLCTMSQS